MPEWLFRGVSLAFACFCVGTTVVQAIALTRLSAAGLLSTEKLPRYAAVIYGLDLSQLPTKDGDQTEELLTRDEIINDRVEKNPLLDDRRLAIQQGTSEVRRVFENLWTESDRFEKRKIRFDEDLANQEVAAREAAIQEVQRTLASLKPRQSKELILKMLENQDVDPADDVLRDIVTIITAMSEEKVKKIFREFKTELELEQLHQIMVEIGQLD